MALYAFDGTGDRWDRKTAITPTATAKNGFFPGRRYLTNVVFFFNEYQKLGLQAEYFSGVGSSGLVVDSIFGGGLGVGVKLIANRAFKELKKNFQNGDTDIDIVGYSRGAASARIFAHTIFEQYQRIKDSNGEKLTKIPEIRFIGLFDTVVSIGNPFSGDEVSFVYKFDHTLPENVNNAYHAMALDLNRTAFGLDRIEAGNDVKFQEVWFRGGHGDIGGNSSLKPGIKNNFPPSQFEKLGSPNRLRSNFALIYMLKKAKSVGINFSDEMIKGFSAQTDINAPIIINNTILDRKAGSLPDASRKPRDTDLFHYSLFDTQGQVVSRFDLSGYEDQDFAKRLVTLPEGASSRIERD